MVEDECFFIWYASFVKAVFLGIFDKCGAQHIAGAWSDVTHYLFLFK